MRPEMRKAFALFGVGASLGAAVWLLSPWLTGRVEPWDADVPIWSASWLLVAVVGGALGGVRGVCLPLGYAAGQMLITVQSVFKGEFGALGWAFIAAYAAVASGIALALAGAVAAVRAIRRAKGGLRSGA